MNEFEYTSTAAGESPMSIVCEQARLFGATPERDEFDPREVWDEDDALICIRESVKLIADVVTPEGTQLGTSGKVCCGDSATCSMRRSAGWTGRSTGSRPSCATCSTSRTARRSVPTGWN